MTYLGRVLLSFLGLAAAVSPVPAAARTPPPLAAYARLPNVSQIELSPDGRRWAAILGSEREAQIQVRDLATSKILAVSPAGETKVRAIQWVGSDHLVVTVSQTGLADGVEGGKREWFQLLALDIAAGKWRRLLTSVENAMNVVVDTPTSLVVGGRPVLIAPGISWPAGGGTRSVSTLFRVPLDHGTTTVIERGNPDTEDWLIGPDGEPVARADHEEISGRWRLYLRKGSGWQRVYEETALVDRPGLRAIGPDGRSVVVVTKRSGEWQNHEVSLADGSWSEAKPDYDADAMILDPATRTVIGAVDVQLDKVAYRFTSPDDQKLWQAISRAFPDELVTLASWSADRMTAIVEVDGATNGDGFFVVDRKARTADWLAPRYLGIEADDMAVVKPFTYKAADGTAIPAYLTLPRGRPDKALPLIVLPHGGPAARDTPGFDWWAQAIASRGYAVLQPQFRGSTGFGSAHRDAGFGEWGRKMQTDLSDGVRHLAAQGTIDPRRVCIAGASYGGYAALAGVTLDPGVYRCASAVAGVSDLRRMLRDEATDSGGRNNGVMRWWRRFMGAVAGEETKLDTVSPARLADRVQVPVQLIHGKDDTVVPILQSNLMEKALRDAGKPVEMVTLPGEDHWLSRPGTRARMLETQVAFLEKHNPPDPPAAAAAP